MIGAVLLAVLAGALTWSLLEYVIHRGLGHGKLAGRNPFGAEHIRHHIEGGYFSPSWKKALIALVAAIVLSVPATWVLGRTVGVSYVAGLILLYGLYELVHRLEHVYAGLGPYGRWARRHHFTHHFTDARKNHGVTSPLWDVVFGTYQAPGKITVPYKLRMAWLIDPTSGAVRADWADTFVLAPPREPR